MKHAWVLFVLTLFVGIGKTSAHVPKEGKVTAAFGPYLYKSQLPSKVDVDSPLFAGLGLVAEADIDSSGGVEVAMFYMPKIYYRSNDEGTQAEKIKRIYITLGYRHWFAPSFSAALALFSSYSMGDPVVYHTDFAPGEQPTTSAQDITEYGFDFSLQVEPWRYKDLAVVVDLRYSLSVTNKSNEHSNHYGVLVGSRFDIQ